MQVCGGSRRWRRHSNNSNVDVHGLSFNYVRSVILRLLRAGLTDIELFENLLGCGYADIMVRCLLPDPTLRIGAAEALQKMSAIAGRRMCSLPRRCEATYEGLARSIYHRCRAASVNDDGLWGASEFITGAIYSGTAEPMNNISPAMMARMIDIMIVLGCDVWL
jgi:hypothetical protein